MNIKKPVLLLILLTSLTGTYQPVIAEEAPLLMGVFPRRNFTNTIRMFTPLAEHLSKKLDRKVQLVAGQDFGSFWQGSRMPLTPATKLI